MTILIAASSGRRRSSRVSSKPSMPGIMRSVITQSGRASGMSRTAPALDARTTTSWPASVSRRETSASVSGSSSTMKNFMGAVILVDDEEPGPDFRAGAVRFRVVRNLVARARLEGEPAAVRKLGVQLAFGAKQDVALDAPVVRNVAGRILDHAHANAAEVARAPVRDPALALMLGGLDLRPVCRAEWDFRHLHVKLLR